MPIFNLNPSSYVPITIGEGLSWEWFATFEEDVEGLWYMVISQDKDGLIPIKALSIGNGITITGKVLKISQTNVQNTLKRAEYFYGVRQDLGNQSKYPFHGPFTVQPVIPKRT